MNTDRLILIILDGWGHGQIPKSSAIAQANTPYIDSLYHKYPNSELVTYGLQVGLPEGQMGNSEVGHLNIGAGRIVYQELARINKAVKEQQLHQNATLLEALQIAKAQNKAVHFMGLLSDGGVHSHINHLKALCDIATQNENEQVFIHAFMDGRDTDPKGGKAYLSELLEHIKDQPAKLATVIGRYFAMDRDKRWERIKLAYDLLTASKGEKSKDILGSMEERYAAGETDEFIAPLVCVDQDDQPVAVIQPGDVLICYNFRTDRPREISAVLTQKDFPEYEMKCIPLHYVTMTRYDETFKGIKVLFEKDDIANTLGEVLSNQGKTQVRIAETEKYPHVTFFFSGGREEAFAQENRILIPSPKVATYDLKPDMGAYELTEAIIKDIRQNHPNFICLNYANADMVGHTGDFQAAIKAAEVVDDCLKTLLDTALAHDYEAIIIADHGNSDYMINRNGTPNTAHTKNPVPCFFVSKNNLGKKLKDGKLADIAPTILSRFGIAIPSEMDGGILIQD